MSRMERFKSVKELQIAERAMNLRLANGRGEVCLMKSSSFQGEFLAFRQTAAGMASALPHLTLSQFLARLCNVVRRSARKSTSENCAMSHLLAQHSCRLNTLASGKAALEWK